MAAGVGERGLGLLVLGLAVDDDGVALAAEGPGRLPDLLHQHAGGVVLGYLDALANEPLLVLIGGAEGGNDDHVLAGERVPEGLSAGGPGGRAPVKGEGRALVALEIAQAA